METYIFHNQLVLHGKVKDLLDQLMALSRDYDTLQELIKDHLH